MVSVNTIRGPIDSSELGRTLSHEHLTTGGAGMDRIPGLMDHSRKREMVDRSVAALARVRQSGIDTIIDLTPFDLGRQQWLFREVAARHPPRHQDVAGTIGMEHRSRISKGLIHGKCRLTFLPCDRKLTEIKLLDRAALTHDCRNRLAAKADLAFGKDRLIGKVRNDIKKIAAWDILCRKYADQSRMASAVALKIAEGESGAMER